MASLVEITINSVPDHDEIKIIKLKGEIDESNLDDFRQVTDQMLADDTVQKLIFNLHDLSFINSKVIGYLASFYNQLNAASKKMAFAEANSSIMEILSLVGLTNLIEYYDQEDEAVSAFIIE